MEGTYSSEVGIDFQRTALCFILKHETLHNNHCHNFKSYGQLVETLFYKPEGRGFHFPLGQWILLFNLPNISSLTVALGSTQPV
jgi:hypothetical protein